MSLGDMPEGLSSKSGATIGFVSRQAFDDSSCLWLSGFGSRRVFQLSAPGPIGSGATMWTGSLLHSGHRSDDEPFRWIHRPLMANRGFGNVAAVEGLVLDTAFSGLLANNRPRVVGYGMLRLLGRVHHRDLG